jgi:hypothetical protein
MTDALRIVVARIDPGRNCFSRDGELLVAALPTAVAKLKLRKGDHFFVGLDTAAPSLYGWVAAASPGVTTEDVLRKALNSPAVSLLGDTPGVVEAQVRLTLEAVRHLPLGCPVVSDFAKRSFQDHALVQKVHRVFFSLSGAP